MDSFG
ncbi:hypothetical protein AYI68_g7490, partial [Smittium mucronatum]